MGQNDHIKNGTIVIQHFWTDSGPCYLMEPKFTLNENDFNWFELQIKPKESYYNSIEHDSNIHLKSLPPITRGKVSSFMVGSI